ncbi:oxygenase MpaB family protein [Chryseobacterium fluminis]|uniref:oxygenase MpaB family protein n=1 Tax=Chryseobacterium fluminis TaxID=2983606 RepID=UPI00224FF763|nr:oxygenase MpaB family protein [Chryseobacterium sp. MMS21-Ot14]UZT99957.1 oxygenase MpaB family protein [Chryseobacterium sp. MMS21-Ot14]
MERASLQPRFKDSQHFRDFWTKGNGRHLIEFSGAQVNFNDFEKFSPYFYHIDQVGDEVVKDVYFNKKYAEASREIENYIRNGVREDDEVWDSVKNLFLQTQHVPDWLDYGLLKSGAELCMRSNLDSLISLRDYCLMGGYDYAYLNKPLIVTEALKKGAVKRLSETLDFWVNVTRYDALEIHKKGYEFAIKTRLIHSYARLSIKKHYKDWDTENWGEPINSWDMMATYIGFSLVFLHSLKKLGNTFSIEEEKGLFHLWKYVGYLLGIPQNLLPNDKKQATEYFYLWTSVQPSSDKDSVLLAHSLLNESLENPILKYSFQRKNLRYLHLCCTWYLLDDEVCRRLQIPDVKNKKLFPKTKWLINKVYDRLVSREARIRKGNKDQMKVLGDYLSITKNSNFH